MAYEDIYKGLTDEQKQEMLKADIPKFEVIGDANLTEEQMAEGRKTLFRFMEQRKKALAENRIISLNEDI
mgnify:FL=1